MICRTCRGSGKTNHFKATGNPVIVEDVLDEFIDKVLAAGTTTSVITKKTCPNCYGSGKVLNKEISGPKTGRFLGRQLNQGRR